MFHTQRTKTILYEKKINYKKFIIVKRILYIYIENKNIVIYSFLFLKNNFTSKS